MRLVNNLYCYLWNGAGNNANTFLIGGEVPTLIDPGHVTNEFGEPCLARLIGEMAADGFQPEDIKLVVATHLHNDHCAAAREFIERGGARLAFHREEERLAKEFGRRGAAAELEADFYLTEEGLELGTTSKVRVEVYHTPGHSPGSVCLYLPEEKALISGDLVFVVSVGRTDIPGGDLGQLQESIEKVSKLDIEHLLPGHMGMLSGRDRVQRNFEFVQRMFFL